jgi:hypothetical protein
MQPEDKKQNQEQKEYCEIALLTRRERDWLLGNIDISKPYGYRLKSGIKKKIQTFFNVELPLLVKNNLITPDEPESRRLGFGDETYSNNSSLGKAKVPGIVYMTKFYSPSCLILLNFLNK